MIKEAIADTVKVAPPATVSVLKLFEIPLSQWVLILTAIYTALMIFVTVRKLLRSSRVTSRDPACAEECPFALRIGRERARQKEGA